MGDLPSGPTSGNHGGIFPAGGDSGVGGHADILHNNAGGRSDGSTETISSDTSATDSDVVPTDPRALARAARAKAWVQAHGTQ